MGAMRKCCGYYCAMIAVVAVFFYGVMIAMEMRKNQFVLYKLQFPEGTDEDIMNSTGPFKGKNITLLTA